MDADYTVESDLLQHANNVVQQGQELQAAAVSIQESQHCVLQLCKPTICQHLLCS